MLTYADLPLVARCAVQLAFFLTVCVGGCLLIAAFSRLRPLHRIAMSLCLLGAGLMMIIYTAQSRALLKGIDVPGISLRFTGRPLVIQLGLLAAAICYFIYIYVCAFGARRRGPNVTRSSIKEAVDLISTGLCFHEPDGRVILVNRCMNELSHAIAGSELQNAALFWDTLTGGETMPGVTRLAYGSYPGFRLPDGTVWTFAREELNGFIQITAADTTLQQALTDQLREKNIDLAAMNLRLRRYNENVVELTRARERLETKARVHGELGQALLATRRYLADQSSREPPLDVWRLNIAMLRNETQTRSGEDPMRLLSDAAGAAGISITMTGEVPEMPEHRQFFLAVASEAMTNAVFHANARNLRIEITETPLTWRMRFTNDGERPDGKVTEGGGLTSLRRKAEYIGAVMTVTSIPEFALSVECRKA